MSTNYKNNFKYHKDSFGPVCQIWSVNLTCMRDSKPQCCVQQHKSLKITRNPTNRNKHINEASKQTFATIFLKYHANTRKVCFPIGRFVSMSSIHELMNERLCNLSKFKETVMYTTCTNFSI